MHYYGVRYISDTLEFLIAFRVFESIESWLEEEMF